MDARGRQGVAVWEGVTTTSGAESNDGTSYSEHDEACSSTQDTTHKLKRVRIRCHQQVVHLRSRNERKEGKSEGCEGMSKGGGRGGSLKHDNTRHPPLVSDPQL